MTALELVCRLVFPAKGRRGRRRRAAAPAMRFLLADPDVCRPDELIPFADYRYPFEETR